jgi:hypothetical protein
VVFGTGCSGGSSEKDAKAEAEHRMGEALSQGSAGKTKVDLGSKGSVDLSGLPEDLRCPGAKAVAHTSNAGPGGGETYILQTDDPPSAVAAHYKQQLASWKQVHAFETAEMTTLVYQTQDGARQVSVITGPDRKTGKTNVSVSFTK